MIKMPESFSAKGADQTTARDVDVAAPPVDEAADAATKEAEMQKNKEELKEKIGEQRRRRRNTSEEPNSTDVELPQRRFERRRSRDATAEQENGVSEPRVRRRSRTPSIDQGELPEAAQQNGNGVRRRSRTPALESQGSQEEKNMFSATVASSHRVRRRSRDENSLSDAPELPSDVRRRPKVSSKLRRGKKLILGFWYKNISH